ncbi:MAG: VWA domain-containing protein [Candidatus Methanomethylophilaceae archaeon]|nr:VWA domain-containing protein [Candidatus Methanomethylophilaceae archaeon]
MAEERLNGSFSYSAILGMDLAKDALAVALVSPEIKTVLIRGVSGSAKTTLVRSVPGTFGKHLVNIPPNTNESQIFGGIDLEKTVVEGRRHFSEGLITRANGGLLHADDVNLMYRPVLNSILESVINGKVLVERDGISSDYSCDTKFLATMNISESELDSHILDKFDICIGLEAIGNEETRYEIVRRRISYDTDPESFCEAYAAQNEKIYEKVTKAKERLEFVSLSEDILQLIGAVCSELGVEGHRGDLAVANASRAIAALDGRDNVGPEDVKKAARICLSHRVSEIPSERKSSSDPGKKDSENKEMGPSAEDSGPGNESARNDTDSSGEERGDRVFGMEGTFNVIDFVSSGNMVCKGRTRCFGKRGDSSKGTRSGRYIASAVPTSKTTDVAIDASLRVAAPYQRTRRREGVALVVEPSDLRQKIREKKSGTAILFLVDSSGSMGARRRMVAVKGAVFALLQESYKNRDKVALISFRKETAEVLLPFTKSVDFAYSKLKEMPTGGGTPLAAAILKAYQEVHKELKANPGVRCYIILATDGRGNVPMSGGDARQDALKAASFVGSSGCGTWIVADTGTGFPHTDDALRVCERMNGVYLKLDRLSGDDLAGRIKILTEAGR